MNMNQLASSVANAQNSLLCCYPNLAQCITQLSSELPISNMADDSKMMSMLSSMRGETVDFEPIMKNMQAMNSTVQSASVSLNQIKTILSHMRSLVIQGSDTVTTSKELALIQREMDELASNITQIADNTIFNHCAILKGAIAGLSLQTMANPLDVLSLMIDPMDASSLGVSDVTARTGLNIMTTDDATIALIRIDDAMSLVGKEQAKLESIQRRLQNIATSLLSLGKGKDIKSR
jgi:flagellin